MKYFPRGRGRYQRRELIPKLSSQGGQSQGSGRGLEDGWGRTACRCGCHRSGRLWVVGMGLLGGPALAFPGRCSWPTPSPPPALTCPQVIAGAGLDVDFTLESPQGVLLVSESRKADGVHT